MDLKSMNQLKQISEMKVAKAEPAFRRLLIQLEKTGYKIKSIHPINQNRYCIVKGEPENILIMFKTAPFFNFRLEFRKEGEHGVGETINRTNLQEAVAMGVTRIYTMYPNGIAYTISVEDFLLKSHRRIVKEGKEVFSISIHHLKRFAEI